MTQYRINIDGRECLALPGQTILEACRANGAEIPTLCHNDLTEVYGACGICVVEVAGNAKLVKSCSTDVADGMSVVTDSPRIRGSRCTTLELLLSDHTGDCVAPCKRACPGNTDCQGYVGLIANGEFDAALKLIREKIPLPAAIGRVCPHPCESDCRRGLVEQPISIASLKRFAADVDIALTGGYVPECAPDSGKSVAVVGGGPYGLSAAYYLRRKGHAVTIFEAMPKLGGMLRYGIPEYRLPKSSLDLEIELILKLGVTVVANTRVGTDVTLESLRSRYDAVCVGIGAWESTGVGANGEDLPGVIGGIEFLRSVERGEPLQLGARVAVVGGGNTAMDACRTAVRLGASAVCNVYRRTKDEMPADPLEILEAEEEGVLFMPLTNPLEIAAGDNGRVNRITLQVMELGEPDASGRRTPVPVRGKTETLEVDTVILAVGQAVNAKGFEPLTLTRKGGIACDAATFATNVPGVFVGGDCGNDKISIAIAAIADAERGAEIVDAYLAGESAEFSVPYRHVRDDVGYATFEERERVFRVNLEAVEPEVRKSNFLEVVPNGFTAADAVAEAARCLECGCGDYFECKLLRYAREYEVEPSRFAGEKSSGGGEPDHPLIVRNMDKCILCGQCVRICDEVVGACALGFVGRGFDASAMPTFERDLADSGCISCGMCVAVCPTGALLERTPGGKSVPLETVKTSTTCPHCSVGCSMVVESCCGMLVRALPDSEGAVNAGLLCKRGRFGFNDSRIGALAAPLIRRGDALIAASYHDAIILAAKGLQRAQAVHGQHAAAIAVSARLTNEEILAAKRLADSIGARIFSFDNSPSGLAGVLGADRTPNGFDEFASTQVIVAVSFNAEASPIVMMRLRQAAKRGVRVVLINPVEGYGDLTYGEIIRTDSVETFLHEMLAELDGDGSGDAARLAREYRSARSAMLVFQRDEVSPECAELIAQLAVDSGHLGSARNGIVQIRRWCNSQGVVDAGVTLGAEALAGVNALLVFGECPDRLPESLEFTALCHTHLQESSRADVVLPASGFATVNGSFTNSEGRVQRVLRVVDSKLLTTSAIAEAIANALGK
ncbi:MAG: FAD-dependent oxidoreductase [Oscillospiraceae bacterium]|jgi:formate dehydrogenase major subunit|nr:FAD-dependent oxidoreductase [Oscillospiraceae bacterium]